MVNTIDQYASKLEVKLAVSERHNAKLLTTTDHVLRRVLPSHLIDRAWSASSGELIQREEVELYDNMLMLAFSLQFNRNCQVVDTTTASEAMLLLNTFANMVDDELVGDNSIIRLEQLSNIVVVGTFNGQRLTWLTALALRFVDKVLLTFLISIEKRCTCYLCGSEMPYNVQHVG
jgi:hypothetical protein